MVDYFRISPNKGAIRYFVSSKNKLKLQLEKKTIKSIKILV